nr:CD225/dispanin family protein [Mycobacterium sp. DL99]
MLSAAGHRGHRQSRPRCRAYWAQGRYAEAQKSADDAKKFAIWGAAAGVVVAVIWVIIAVVDGMAGMSSSGY